VSVPIAIVDDPLFDEHRSPGPHPERPERLVAARRAARSVAARAGTLEISPRPASDDELGRVHTARYLQSLGRAAGSFVQFDEDTYSAPRSVQAARSAAGGAVELVEALVARRALRGVALLRPPGHHARPDHAMGFCLLNNVAVAAAHARACGVEKVLVLDFDVHHGNGTQEMFYEHPDVLFVSLHQFPFYPGSGAVTETGRGEGRGFTLNVPLGAGAGDAEYSAAFVRLVVPVVSEFSPGLVLLSAGFDAHRDDPLGQMRVTEAGFGTMTRLLLGALQPDTPVGALLEGGYDLRALEASLTKTLEVLVGLDDGTERGDARGGAEAPPRNETDDETGVVLPSPRHGEELDRACRVAAEFWRLG
jgi:acetoin utilization deacetylase AcuC-like enzyme